MRSGLSATFRREIALNGKSRGSLAAGKVSFRLKNAFLAAGNAATAISGALPTAENEAG